MSRIRFSFRTQLALRRAFAPTTFAVVVLLLASAVGCAPAGDSAPPEAQAAEPPPAAALATLAPTEGNRAAGTISFTETEIGVRVSALLTGVPEGVHGIHVHENGDCSAPDASSAGGHFNPQATPHGPQVSLSAQRHAGDLGNLVAGADGSAAYEGVDLVLGFGADTLVGRAVVLHGGRDDLTSQPAGDAGPRIACGVIEAR
ncbi:MAG TPA: superoxide dismutase family protein [Thermoanaerobaculia bacterium]|nr:superoxide dismutase family protein [Thermoanaerobaculia bacterium]